MLLLPLEGAMAAAVHAAAAEERSAAEDAESLPDIYPTPLVQARCPCAWL